MLKIILYLWTVAATLGLIAYHKKCQQLRSDCGQDDWYPVKLDFTVQR